MEHRDLVIIGSGMAATRLVATLRRRGDRRSMILLGAERALPYNRIMLSPLLAGEAEWQQLVTHSAEWYAQENIDLHLGHAVVEVDTVARTVRCADGYQVSYNDVVFATGSRSALPPLAGIDLPGVTGFRDYDDVTRLQQATHRGGNAVVLGGGLLGLEAAVALAARGMTVTLIHRAKQLMNRQLDVLAAQYLQQAITARGVTVRTGFAPRAILGAYRPTAVVLDDGSQIPADLVVVATGIQPITEIAAAAGLQIQRGIVVDQRMRASAAHAYALGECCELNGETVGLVAPIWEQVDVLAANLCGEEKIFAAKPYVTMLKVSGIDVHAMGEQDVSEDVRMLTYQDREHGIYKKILVRDSVIVGALLYGDIADSQMFFNLIQTQTEIGSDYCRLLLAGELTAAPVKARA
ncbi:MAG: nitrite reductase large subunit [Verrucomicrobiaceae bacterium]|nr:nitrite reductase large subunit [Verrucomicrobiaceae bacterium]